VFERWKNVRRDPYVDPYKEATEEERIRVESEQTTQFPKAGQMSIALGEHIDAIRRLLAAQTDALAHLSRVLAVVQFDLAGIRKMLEEKDTDVGS